MAADQQRERVPIRRLPRLSSTRRNFQNASRSGDIAVKAEPSPLRALCLERLDFPGCDDEDAPVLTPCREQLLAHALRRVAAHGRAVLGTAQHPSGSIEEAQDVM